MPALLVLSPTLESGAITDEERRKDAWDTFNHPRERRRLILEELQKRPGVELEICNTEFSSNDDNVRGILDEVYRQVHSKELLDFLSTAWNRWESLGENGQDPSGCMSTASSTSTTSAPPLIPSNNPLLRDSKQRPSQHVLGQIGYYCTDTCTPIFGDLCQELALDAALIRQVLQKRKEKTSSSSVIYLLPTHPGHHAAYDSFGGYCYVNHVAALARGMQSLSSPSEQRVAILDVDYHCGNGTASIFQDDDSILVVSIHCDPDHEYPFHSGFADESNKSLLHLPLPPGTTWQNNYRGALETGLQKIVDFGAQTVIVSLGLDTHDQDPCAIRRAGFCLSGEDYVEMGRTMAMKLPLDVSVIFSQEGGYRMDRIGKAAADVVFSFVQERGREECE